MGTSFEKDLGLIGLSEKASKVYLASLELGAAPVQAISKKAGVNRPTTYVMIEDLINKGLMSTFDKGKKRFFVAENPDRLRHLVVEQKKRVDEMDHAARRILHDLHSLAFFSKDRPTVAYYEGQEGIHALREDVLRSGEKELLEIVPVDLVRKFVPEEALPDDLRHEIRKKIKVKSLYTSGSGAIFPKKHGNNESRYLSPEKFPFENEIIIFGERAAFFTFEGKPNGVLVHSKEIASTMRVFFLTLWKIAEN